MSEKVDGKILFNNYISPINVQWYTKRTKIKVTLPYFP